jgi:regulatory protein
MQRDSDPVPPDAASLHQAALAYLARYAATEAGLRRVLRRRIDRWARSQPDPDGGVLALARSAVEGIVSRLAEAGAVSDAGFADMRAKSLIRSGKSGRSVQALLAAKGVASAIARDAVPDDPDLELAAALVTARRRRIGPYRTNGTADTAARSKELGRLARAGFSRDTAQRALDMTEEEAERRIHDLRR